MNKVRKLGLALLSFLKMNIQSYFRLKNLKSLNLITELKEVYYVKI